MGASTILFSNSSINARITATAGYLRAMTADSDSMQKLIGRLSEALDIVAANSESFDENCQFNIQHIANNFSSTLVERGGPTNAIDVQRLSVLLLRFVTEYDISVANELSPELRGFVETVVSNSENFSPEMQLQVDFAQHRLPVSMLKHLMNSNDFVSLRNVQQIAQNTEERLTSWKTEIAASEKRVETLQSTLSVQEQNFNFVGLSKGFWDLGKQIETELGTLQKRLIFFGLLLLVPVSAEFIAVTRGWVDTSASPILLGASGLASVTATLLLLYFFRITLHNADGCRAQLVQIRLRMALCRFIQSYADYSTEIKAKNSDALSKFESLIFSGIVSTDEKLPSTFDGIEQLSGLLKNLRGGK